MQLASILILTIQAVGVLSAPHAGNEGDAPDIANSSLPPPGTAWESLSERSNPLIARNCVDSAPFGCDLKKGRCWKVCGDHGECNEIICKNELGESPVNKSQTPFLLGPEARGDFAKRNGNTLGRRAPSPSNV
ncbi:hypothetical protein O988_02211 [Pseudogymnoascus sp. VKM F-3808]|nr:hypothetical protein O988_02211 [Pseudogymnoascus sp. VKM F-3808]